MKQILQNLKTGDTEVADVPCPRVGTGQLLIRTTRSLISAGTERMLVDFGRASLLDKARQQPDKVRMVVDKVRTDGVLPTLDAVRQKLDQPLPLGYCNVGVVTQVGAGVSGFSVGDRVASNGWHAEMVSVPSTLCARIPDGVGDEAAAFTVIGAVALQGLRLAAPTLGECFAVTGVGLVGLIAVQLLRASGCRVLAIDIDESRLALAKRFGAETLSVRAGGDPLAAADRFSRGRGVDGVLLTLASKDSEAVMQAARMCRTRGRIVLVGVTGLELNRADFYQKELSFQVSCSYGPGRYDPSYEEQGRDYPIGFVRWTEQRNFEAVLDMLSHGRLETSPLVSHRFALEDAARAYAVVAGAEASRGIILEYAAHEHDSGADPAEPVVRLRQARATATGATARPVTPAVSFLGTGHYATAVLIPAFKAGGARLVSAASSMGVSGTHASRKYGFEEATTDPERLLADPSVDAVVISTRHDSHARYVLDALAAGKHVFVEKPLCLTLEELAAIEAAYESRAPSPESRDRPLLMVGFNRRFAPHVRRMSALLEGTSEPRVLVMTVNAGAVPAGHWTQDPVVGGGRIVGEACHFIDLLRFLAGSAITSYTRLGLESTTHDTVSLQLGFSDGSIGSIHYVANGSKAFPKERLEVFTAGRVLQLDNFRVLRGYGWPGFGSMRLWRQDKGQKACADAFLQAVRSGGPSPIPFAELCEVSRVSIELA
jgi:predicted dehydrogenase/threonine dehydrogenase-like Zn-dependent dehydrogenase